MTHDQLRPVARACLLVATLCLAACASPPPAPSLPAPASPATPSSTALAPWYEPEIRAFEAADRAAPPAPGQVLFIGSSSIKFWKSLATDMSPLPVLNRGFGGSKTREVLAVFDRIVTPYTPSVIVYYCGDNDLGTDNTDSKSAADGFIRFDRRCREQWPGIRVIYIPIKASIARWSNWPAMQRANALVRDYCSHTPGAVYVDTVTPTLGTDAKPDPSLFESDGLHINAKGYELWTRTLKPAVVDAYEHRNARSPSSSSG
ncbi:MAG: GDSL-type esterase/lipase family protein [Phycisphaerales bacterium]